MNSKQKKTLQAVFRNPVPATIAWADIEGLLIAVGCEVLEGTGSRVRFARGAQVETFHRPHPDKEAKQYQVRSARAFLTRLGEAP